MSTATGEGEESQANTDGLCARPQQERVAALTPCRLTARVRCLSVAQVMVEVRDARLPLSCRHPAFDGWAAQGNRTTLLVYTHADLLSDDEVHTSRAAPNPPVPPPSARCSRSDKRRDF